jgi:hypothetical protein
MRRLHRKRRPRRTTTPILLSASAWRCMAPIEIARAPSHELDAVLRALLRGRFTGLSDGLRIGIEAHHLTGWKCLGYCHCNTADAPARH